MVESILDEYRRMLNGKMIFSIIFIIPIIVNLLLGYEFSYDQIQHIPMAIIDQDNSTLSRTIIRSFSENEIFDVKYYIDDPNEMKKLLDNSTVRVGMIIPKDFYSDVTKLNSPTILMLYDGSHMSIASAAKTRATEILLTTKVGATRKVLSGKLSLPADVSAKLAQPVTFSNRFLYNPTKSFKNFLTPGFGVAIVQTAIVLMAVVSIRRKRVTGDFLDKYAHVLGKVLFYSLLGTLSLMICILIQSLIFKVPYRGSYLTALILSLLFALAVSSFAILVSVWVGEKMLCTLIVAVLFIPNTIMVGYTWPVMAMPSIYKSIANCLPFYHYADNIRDLFLKGSTLSSCYSDIVWFLIFTLICLIFIGLGTYVRLGHFTLINKITLRKDGGKNAVFERS